MSSSQQQQATHRWCCHSGRHEETRQPFRNTTCCSSGEVSNVAHVPQKERVAPCGSVIYVQRHPLWMNPLGPLTVQAARTLFFPSPFLHLKESTLDSFWTDPALKGRRRRCNHCSLLQLFICDFLLLLNSNVQAVSKNKGQCVTLLDWRPWLQIFSTVLN